jgi:hypothetical protein
MPSRTLTHAASSLAIAVVFTAGFANAWAANDARPSKSAAGKTGKREKALMNMVEKVSFPHEDVEPKALVKAPRIESNLKTAGAKSRGRRRPAPPPVQDAQPGVVFDTAPATPPPAAAAPPPPPEATRPASETLKPHEVPKETGKSIDALVAKAFVPAEPKAEPSAPEPAATGGGTPNPEEIGNVMRDVRNDVKTGCRFGERGTLTVRVEVGAGGRVDNVTPEGPLADRAAAACVAKTVQKLRFPASAGSTFRFPFAVK